jgi:death-on-curing family protein
MKLQKEEQKIIIFKTKSGTPEINVKVEKDTIWLRQEQIASLFATDRTVISRHIGNIFKSKELDEKSNVQKMHIANSDKPIKAYNLDVILSVGYRVNSKRATEFRIWATNILREYLVKGYKVNENRLLEQKEKLVSLKEAIHFIEKKADTYLLQGKSRELLSFVNEFARTLTLLEEYDKNKIKINKTEKAKFSLDYNSCKNIIIELKAELKKEGEGGDLFGQEYDKKFQAVINSIYQTFDKKELYNSVEEKAAHLIYLTIKDHPFADGNKRIASFLFVYFLRENNYLYTRDMQRKISSNTLVPLALLVAASDPREKEVIIKMIMSLLQ